MIGRTERVSGALEAQLDRCARLLKDCDGWIEQTNAWGDRDLRSILGLTKVSAQLASVIGRLEAKPHGGQEKAEGAPAPDLPPTANGKGHPTPANGNGHGISESSGSNPQ